MWLIVQMASLPVKLQQVLVKQGGFAGQQQLPVVSPVVVRMQQSGAPRQRLGTEVRAVTTSAERLQGAIVQRTVVSPGLASRWREVCGAADWEGMMDPLDPDVRAELIRYGEFAQACYDAFDKDEHSKYLGSCRHSKATLLERAGLPDTGYEVTKYLYTTTDVQSLLLRNDQSDSWSRESNWMGYVAVCTDENRVKQLGRRDIVVVWRGTVQKLEWAANIKRNVVPSSLDDRDTSNNVDGMNPNVGLQQGFLSLYTSKNNALVYNKKSAREQVLAELSRLIKKYDDETLSITTTGHSLGAALALLSAYDIAECGINRHFSNRTQPPPPSPAEKPKDTLDNDIPVTCFSFAGPRVGNTAFAARVQELGVKVLRVVNKNDFVPRVPGLIFSGIKEEFDILDKLIDRLPWTYSHCGVELEIDNNNSPFLKPDLGPTNAHNMEVYMHLLAGYQAKGVGRGKDFELQVKRDIALVNKASDALVPQKYIPTCWWQLENKGLVLNHEFHWVQVPRNTEDIPAPEEDDDDDDIDTPVTSSDDRVKVQSK